EVEVEAGVLLVLGQRQTVVAGIGPQPSLEELLYRPPDVGVEALTRHDHHREDPALEGVGPQTQPCAALLLDREDRADVLVELLRVGAEQLLARQRVECRHDGLVVVAARYGLVELQHLAELPSEYGDRFDRRVLRLAGEQAEEAALARYLALVAQDLHAHVVHAPGPVDGGLGVRLGDDEQTATRYALAKLRRELGERDRRLVAAVRLVRQDAQAAARRHLQVRLAPYVDELVLAVAEVDVVLLLQPLHEGRVLGELLRQVARDLIRRDRGVRL